MNINITRFFASDDVDMSHISGSRMEHGPDAARITWRNANEAARDFAFLDTDEKLDAMRAHLKSMGFSEADDGHSPEELNALLLQCIAGDVRDVCGDAETDSPEWWAEHESGAERGTYSGRMYRGDNGDVFYYLGE